VALVDQHAADERVRVERYLKRLCIGFLRNEIEKLQLEPPTKILLTRREIEVLERPVMLDALSRWGLRIELHFTDVQHVSELGSTQDREFCQVDVTAVPDVVSKRVRGSSFKKLVVDRVACASWLIDANSPNS
jgi:DNA mismatch repair protein MLH3